MTPELLAVKEELELLHGRLENMAGKKAAERIITDISSLHLKGVGFSYLEMIREATAIAIKRILAKKK